MYTDIYNHKDRNNTGKKRVGRVQARLFAVLLPLLMIGFASGCTKTETVKADPAVVREQKAEEAATASQSGAESEDGSKTESKTGRKTGPKAATGMEALGISPKKKEAEESSEGSAKDAGKESEGSAKNAGKESEGSAKNAGKESEESAKDAEDSPEGSEASPEAGTGKETAQKQSKAGKTEEDDEATEVTFTAVGDNLINEVLYGQAAENAREAGEEKEYDFAPFYADISPFIREHDVNWIDIETLMTDTLEPSGYPAFSTPGDSGRALIDGGWNVFSICSNHTYDRGTEGIAQTLAFWNTMQEEALSIHKKTSKMKDAEGICCTGLWEYGTEYDIPVLTCKGRKLAFLTYTYGTNNIETPADSPAHVIYLDEEGLMAEQIELAREQADAVIVSLHWGEEYNHYETQWQRDLAQRVADMGADLIIGGHPHVVEGAEMLTAADGRKVFCAYSLGNFICAQNSMPDPDAMIGLVLSCTFRFTQEGVTVEDHALIPILSDYGEDYADDHVVLYSEYSEKEALAHGMRSMYGFTQFDYDYIGEMLTDVVGKKYLQLP